MRSIECPSSYHHHHYHRYNAQIRVTLSLKLQDSIGLLNIMKGRALLMPEDV